MKLVALIRTKNSVLYLEECLIKLSSLVDEIILMDNGSTDGTLEVCKRFPKIVQIIQRDDTGDFNEGRDMNILLEEGKKRNPDWMTMAWPDEVFEKHLTRDILDKYMESEYEMVGFRMCHFWLSMKYCRFDRRWFKYTLTPQRFMWRNLESTYFDNVVIHPGMIKGIHSKPYISPYRIKHYGYVNKEEVVSKMKVFKKADPDGEEKYRPSDMEHKESTEQILYYPFMELDNKILNHLYIIFYDLCCDVLLTLVKIKRRYLGRSRVFR